MEAASPQRVRSIDALRGFDMMMIVGGREVIVGLSAAFASERFHAGLLRQCDHPEWHGFTPWDLIFPLFLFLAGASLPFSFRARQERGVPRRQLVLHTLRRAAVLVALGVLYNGLLGFRFESLRFASVLGRIGLAWAGAALIVLFFSRVRLQVMAFFAVLGLHSALLLFVPMPGLEEVSLDPGLTVTDWIDRHITPGRFYKGDRDPEALMGTIPAIGTALLGSFAGRWIGRSDLRPTQRAGGLVILGLQCLAAGKLLDVVGLPINKNLWTASFVFWAGGWSVLLLALFHVLFDIVKLPRLALFFSVIGANAILAYLAGTFIDFRDIAEVVFARGFEYKKLHPALLPALALAIQWSLLYVLYRRRIFLRV
ncbi:MAG: DUF5009 domain-containing protein [Planctomycetota bacterium]